MGLWKILKGEQPGPIETIKNFENAGQWGEYLTEYMLNERNLSGKLKVLTNAYIPYKNKTTEIDVLMLHEKGIFVFESKNYSGWIFGKADQKQWTQTLKGGKKSSFYNPIMQNQSHINALSDYLALPKTHFHSYIVFSERCELKKVPKDTDDYTILRRHNLLRKLKKNLGTLPDLYSEEAFSMIDQMLDLRKYSEEEAKNHLERVKGYTDGEVCPWCGEPLVERSGKSGAFIGCSGFPKCRFTRKP